MSAGEFLLCLCRFMAHCGVPWQIISDNVKHFKAAKQMLSRAKLQVSDHVDDYLSKNGSHWKFIVELVPRFLQMIGGINWESSKENPWQSVLNRKAVSHNFNGNRSSSYNSHPLVYVDDDINSSMMSILTPSNFLSFHSQHTLPNILDDPDPEFEVAKKATSSQELLLTWKEDRIASTNFGDYSGMNIS